MFICGSFFASMPALMLWICCIKLRSLKISKINFADPLLFCYVEACRPKCSPKISSNMLSILNDSYSS